MLRLEQIDHAYLLVSQSMFSGVEHDGICTIQIHWHVVIIISKEKSIITALRTVSVGGKGTHDKVLLRVLFFREWDTSFIAMNSKARITQG